MTAKRISLLMDIDSDGILHARIEGTEGSECLDVLSLLDRISGLTNVETIEHDQRRPKKTQIAQDGQVE